MNISIYACSIQQSHLHVYMHAWIIPCQEYILQVASYVRIYNLYIYSCIGNCILSYGYVAETSGNVACNHTFGTVLRLTSTHSPYDYMQGFIYCIPNL